MAISPSITSPGVGSGLDVNSIIDKLMTIAKLPLTQLQKKEDDFNAKLSTYGSIKGALSSLQTAADALTNLATFNGRTASAADPTVLSAAAAATAVTGSYNITVSQLATAHTLRSTANYATTTETFTTGTLAISVGGGSPVNVTIDSSNNSLAGIRQAINDANAGVTATIINDGTANRLVLTSKTTGTGGQISVAVTDSGGGGANALAGLDAAGLLQTQQADDALFNINGIDIVRGSNTITDVIEGVTLKLTKGTPLDPASTVLTIGQDTATVGNAVNAFVKAYNDAVNTLKTNSAFNAATQKAAILTGDSTVRSLQTQLSGLLQTVVTGVAGGIGSLADIGITRQTNGTLTVDNTKLNAVINDPSKDVTALFAQTTVGNEGIAVRFKTMLSTATVAGGTIDNRTSGINASLQDIARSREAMNLRMDALEARYRAQFANLDTMMASMQRTSQYLTQQFANKSSS